MSACVIGNSQLPELKRKLELWGEWDDITTLINRRSIQDYLLEFWDRMRQIDNPVVSATHLALEIITSGLIHNH